MIKKRWCDSLIVPPSFSHLFKFTWKNTGLPPPPFHGREVLLLKGNQNLISALEYKSKVRILWPMGQIQSIIFLPSTAEPSRCNRDPVEHSTCSLFMGHSTYPLLQSLLTANYWLCLFRIFHSPAHWSFH